MLSYICLSDVPLSSAYDSVSNYRRRLGIWKYFLRYLTYPFVALSCVCVSVFCASSISVALFRRSKEVLRRGVFFSRQRPFFNIDITVINRIYDPIISGINWPAAVISPANILISFNVIVFSINTIANIPEDKARNIDLI